ncbi:MAG: gliding motility-associated protein GldM [Limisphaerales bacterium]|jgi:gliding motility-associated protein GldM
MAGGKLTPRQKMINLMYLVFIAMLALNMSKEVLSAFGLLNEKISNANVATEERNTAFMDGLATKAIDEPGKYADVKDQADKVSEISNDLDAFISNLKSESIAKLEDPSDYEVMDKADFFDKRFFKGDNYKPEGEAFIAAMNKYRNEMSAALPDSLYPNIKRAINSNFSTSEVENRDGKKIEWLNYNYEGFPLVASLTKLTQIQADIKTTKNEVLSKMLAGEQAASLSYSNYSTLMESPKSAYYTGEKFDGSIVLGRTDESTVPKRAELTLDGRSLTLGTDFTFEGGKVKLNVGAGSPGDHVIEGILYYGEAGKETPVDVMSGFATISMPNAAVIAADKMNVVYRGVVNPMTISIPGIPDNKVRASGAGLSLVSGTKYNMSPASGRTVSITASGTLPDGKPVSSSMEFRIKDIPRPTGTIRGETGDGGAVKMNRQGLEISSIGASLPDFDFDLKLNVTGFSFKVSGQPTVRVSGRKLDNAAKGALRRAKRGDVVQIIDINASISGNSGYKLKKISPVIIELTN